MQPDKTIRDAKKKLRKELREHYARLGAAERQALSEELARLLLKNDFYFNARLIGVTVAAGVELENRPLLQQMLDEGKELAVPLCNQKDWSMQFYKIRSLEEDLRPGKYDIPEPIPERCEAVGPEDIDLMIVPGLAFTPDGQRLGQGGGYYDRYLANFKHRTLGMVPSFALFGDLPTEDWDARVDRVVVGSLLFLALKRHRGL